MNEREVAQTGRAAPAKAGTAGVTETGRKPSARKYTPKPRRKLPPYGKHLAAVLSRPEEWPRYIGTSPDGCHVTLWAICGPKCWKLADNWKNEARLFVVCPPREDPARFDWRLLRDHSPVLIQPCGDLAGEEVQALATALLRDGVRRVMYCGPSGATRYAAPVAGGIRHAA